MVDNRSGQTDKLQGHHHLGAAAALLIAISLQTKGTSVAHHTASSTLSEAAVIGDTQVAHS